MFLLWTFTFTKPKVQILEWFHLWVMHWRSQVSLMYISFSVSWYLRNTHGFFLTWLARCWFQDLKLFYTHCDHTFSPGDFQDCALMASVLARLWEQYLHLETISCVHAAESKVCGWNRSSTTIQTVCDGLRNPWKVVTLQHREKSQCMSVRILWYVLAQSEGEGWPWHARRYCRKRCPIDSWFETVR